LPFICGFDKIFLLMDYKEYFVTYASEVNAFLANFFQEKIEESKKITPVAADMWRKLQKFIVGGKRIRAGLVKLGYECFGGKKKKAILPISAAIEITQGAILIHDDIIDQADFRHNRPTVHKVYEAYHQKKYQKGNALHYGESMAICIGDAGFYQAISLIEKSDFPQNLKLRAIDQLIKFMIETCYGEGLDVDLSYREKVSERAVMIINTLKTARYTLVGPLTLGGILGGAKGSQLAGFEDYGVPIGVAFQLQDDILGMFGSVKKLGKPVDSDIKEGKNTLLYTQALKRGSQQQRTRLISLWGKKDITPEEVKEARGIIRTTGSLNYSQKLARRLVEKGKKAVPKITQNKELQGVFFSLADFIVERER